MKKFKKLMAGLLSFAMVASTLPMTLVSSATEPDSEGYLYKQDFTGLTADTLPKLYTSSVSTSIWNYEVVTEDGNEYLKYSMADAETNTANTSIHYNLLINGASGITFNAGDSFEYGFSVKMNKNVRMQQLMNAGPLGAISYTSPNLSVGGSNISLDFTQGFIDFKMKYEGTTGVTEVIIYDASGVASTPIYVTKSAGCTSFGNFTLQVQSGYCKTMANDDYVAIDDIYIKQLPGSTVTFDSDGGSEVDSLSFIFGTVSLMPEEPAKTGYSFVQWNVLDSDGNPTGEVLTEGMELTSDITVKAEWEAAAAMVSFDTLTDEVETPAPLNVEDGVIVGTLPIIERTGYAFEGWYTDEEFTTPFDGTGVTESITVYAKWRQYVDRTVTFVTNCDETIDTVTVLEGKYTPPTPTNGTMMFDGWYTDAELTTLYSGVVDGGDVTLYAKWSNKIYWLSFQGATTDVSPYSPSGWTQTIETDANGNQYLKFTLAAAASSNSGMHFQPFPKGVDVTDINFEYGFRFAQSINSSNPWNQFTGFTASKIASYNDGNFIELRVVVNNKAGGTQTYYLKDADGVETQVTSSTLSAAMTKLYGVYFQPNNGQVPSFKVGDWYALDDIYVVPLPDYTVTFDANGGEAVDSIAAEMGILPELPSATSTSDGMGFLHWVYVGGEKDGEVAAAGDTITGDVTLKAVWNIERTVSFVTNCDETIEDVKVADGATYTPPTPTNGSMMFEGWFTDAALTTYYSGVIEGADVTLYAKWSNKIYSLNFQGATVDSVASNYKPSNWTPSIETDETGNQYLKLTNSAALTDNYMFNGLPTAVAVSGNFEIGFRYAQNFANSAVRWNQFMNWNGMGDNTKIQSFNGQGFVNVRIVVENVAGGTITAYITGPDGTEQVMKTATLSAALTSVSTAHTQLYNNDKGIVAIGDWVAIDDIYVKALVDYTITLNSNGGTEYDSVTATLGAVPELPTPEKDGVFFAGWYTDETLTTPFTATSIEADITLYAKYAAAKTVTFETNGGDAIESITIAEGNSYEAPTPTKGGYLFTGWYTDAALTVAYTGVITDDVTLYAAWSDNLIYLDFEGDDSLFDTQYYNQFKTPTATDGAQRWTSTIKDGVLTYTRDNTVELVSGGNNYVDSFPLNGNNAVGLGYTLTPDQWYETGFSSNLIDIPLGNNAYYVSFQTANNSMQQGATIAGTYMGANSTLIHGSGSLTYAKAGITGWYDVKVRFMINDDVQYTNDTDAQNAQDGLAYQIRVISQDGAYDSGWSAIKYKRNAASTGLTLNYRGFYRLVDNYSTVGEGTSSYMFDNFYLKAIEEVEEQVVIFNANGGNFADLSDAQLDEEGNFYKTVTPAAGSYLAEAEYPAMESDEYTQFGGWYLDSACTQEFTGTGIDGTVEVYAKWLTKTPVVFDPNNGEDTFTLYTTDGTVDMSEVETPTKVGYYFQGWYTEDGNLFDNTKAPTDGVGITVTAKWSSTVVYEDFEGETYNSKFDTVEQTDSSDKRWTNEVVDINGNKVMMYTRDMSVETNNQTINYNYNYATDTAPVLDRNADYELGYKIDFNDSTVYMQGMGFKFANNVMQGISTVSNISVQNGRIHIGGHREYLSNIDGFITVKTIVNLNGAMDPTEPAESTDYKNGIATTYVSYYNSTTEEIVTYTFTEEIISYSTKVNGNATIDRFWGFGLGEVIDGSAATEGTDCIYLDDVYMRLAEDYTVTFNTQLDGVEVESMVATTGILTEVLPTPTADGYTFVGWYYNKACTNLFTGNTVMGDTTLYALWQQNPTVAAVSVENETNVDLLPKIEIVFDSMMLADTINDNTIKLYKGELEMTTSSYLVTSYENAAKKTVAVLTPRNALDFESDYTVVITTGVANYDGNMEAEYEASFSTAPMNLSAENVTISDDTATYNTIAEATGKTVTITFNIAADYNN